MSSISDDHTELLIKLQAFNGYEAWSLDYLTTRL